MTKAYARLVMRRLQVQECSRIPYNAPNPTQLTKSGQKIEQQKLKSVKFELIPWTWSQLKMRAKVCEFRTRPGTYWHFHVLTRFSCSIGKGIPGLPKEHQIRRSSPGYEVGFHHVFLYITPLYLDTSPSRHIFGPERYQESESRECFLVLRGTILFSIVRTIAG